MICLLFGCAAPGTKEKGTPASNHAAGESPTTRTEIVGDWDDVTAAAEVAVEPLEAVIESTEIGGDDATITIRLVDGEPGALVVTRVDAETMTATARLGRFGRPSEEARLLDAFAHRLRQLHNVDYAPR